MSAEHVNVEIDRLEAALRADDPELVRRCRHWERREAAHVLAVFAFMALGAVLLTTGFAIGSPLAWCAGAGAYVLAVAADRLLRAA
ncbi:MAG: DUF3040 domain-containing protein [Ilumatobacteraceae bacterium]